ncbi:MAG: COX15/CtaA family protein [Terriglobia bacterium]
MADDAKMPARSRYGRYAWWVLAYTVLVILWGTVVRATGSGAGCGDHWPLCEGQFIPHAAQIATLIEFTHRLTSGLTVLLAAGLAYFAFRLFPARHAVRRYAAAAFVFTLMEGLLGAALVLVAPGRPASAAHVAILSLHLVNTFLLLASLALTAQSAGERGFALNEQPVLPPSRGLIAAHAFGLVGVLGIAVTGTIAALADSLHHATSFLQGFQWDIAGGSPLLRLRIIHPVVAVIIGTFLIAVALHALVNPASPAARRAAICLSALVLIQFCFGALNVLLLAPVWLQVLHLLTADLIWISLVLLTAYRLRVPAESEELEYVMLSAGKHPGI